MLGPEVSERDRRDVESNRTCYQPERLDVKFKIVLLGEGGVGKSALVQNALHRPFNDGYDPTIMDSHQAEVSIRGQSCTLDIVDLSSQHDIMTNFESDIYHAAGVIYVYSITDARSFQKISVLSEKIRKSSMALLGSTLVANKLDLEKSRQVPRKDGEEMASQIGAVFEEMSAKEGNSMPGVLSALTESMLSEKEKAA
ncbi:tRNA A64-2'-O-ribosylphosphate transferase [Exophiala xenobiotica]|nr:tRNA A64-2'-O-ribosylphosphate transferase [Exophiala xenobiotica]